MMQNQLINVIDSFIPRFYSYSYALAADELGAEQLIVDAYTVFILKGQQEIMELVGNAKSIKMDVKKYIFRKMLREIYDLACQRYAHKNSKMEGDYLEWSNFFELNLRSRAILFLKEVCALNISEIQSVFDLQRHEVIEAFYNARHELIKDACLSMEG